MPVASEEMVVEQHGEVDNLLKLVDLVDNPLEMLDGEVDNLPKLNPLQEDNPQEMLDGEANLFRLNQ